MYCPFGFFILLGFFVCLCTSFLFIFIVDTNLDTCVILAGRVTNVKNDLLCLVHVAPTHARFCVLRNLPKSVVRSKLFKFGVIMKNLSKMKKC